MPRTKIELKDAKSRSTRYKRKKEIVEQARALELETVNLNFKNNQFLVNKLLFLVRYI